MTSASSEVRSAASRSSASLGFLSFLSFGPRAPAGEPAPLGTARTLISSRTSTTVGSRHRELGRKSAPDHHVGPAPREPELELTVAFGGADARALEGAPEPCGPHRQLEALASGIELVDRK